MIVTTCEGLFSLMRERVGGGGGEIETGERGRERGERGGRERWKGREIVRERVRG